MAFFFEVAGLAVVAAVAVAVRPTVTGEGVAILAAFSAISCLLQVQPGAVQLGFVGLDKCCIVCHKLLNHSLIRSGGHGQVVKGRCEICNCVCTLKIVVGRVANTVLLACLLIFVCEKEFEACPSFISWLHFLPSFAGIVI